MDQKFVLYVKKSAENAQFMSKLRKNGHYGPFLEKRHTEYFLICHFGESLGYPIISLVLLRSFWKTRPKNQRNVHTIFDLKVKISPVIVDGFW
jgi:hypothetical protein